MLDVNNSRTAFNAGIRAGQYMSPDVAISTLLALEHSGEYNPMFFAGLLSELHGKDGLDNYFNAREEELVHQRLEQLQTSSVKEVK